MDRDLTDSFALAVDTKDSLAGGDADVVDVEGDDLADAGPGVERDERERLVAGRGTALDGSQVAQLVFLGEGTGCRRGQLEPGGAGGSEVPADVRSSIAASALLTVAGRRLSTACRWVR